MRLRGLTPETVGLSIGMRRPVIAATKKRRDLAGPPLDLIDSLSEPQGLVAATAEETESTQRTKKGSGGLGDSGGKLEARGARLDRGSNC